jgi:1-acyl-sn-glycerol-3-phosphate acyltransferase
MDALAILLLVDKQPVFMARADIFKKNIIKKILHFLKIIPVFRIRDGVDSLTNNDQSFGIALRALGYGQAVGIMPEGNHGDQRRIRPLKKGIVRFALNAQENFGTNIPVKIIPVGIEYSHYSHFRSKLLVIFGHPIDVTTYLKAYKENPQIAYNSLLERLEAEMKKNMLNINNSEYYDLIFRIKDMYAPRLREKQGLSSDYYFSFLAEKQVTDMLVIKAKENSEVLESLKEDVNEYYKGLKKLNLRNWVLNTTIPEKKELAFDLLRYLVFLPFFIAASAFNFIPYFVSGYIGNKAKDPQFRSSIKFVTGSFLFPLYYLLFIILPLPLLIKIIFIVTMPLLGILSFDYFIGLKKQWAKLRYFRMLKHNDNELLGLKHVRDRIFSNLDKIFL